MNKKVLPKKISEPPIIHRLIGKMIVCKPLSRTFSGHYTYIWKNVTCKECLRLRIELELAGR